MGGSLCKEQADTRPATKKFTLWGDYMNSDTKAILSVLTLCKIEHEYRNVETMLEEHKRSVEFTTVSPI